MIVRFFPSMVETTAAPGENLLAVADRAGVLIDASCAGAGTCGKCKVRIDKGELPPLAAAELEHLSAQEVEEGYRLACCLNLASDVDVSVPGVHGNTTRKKKMTRLPDEFTPDIRIRATYLKVPKATMDHQVNDLARIAQSLSLPKVYPERTLLERVHAALDGERGKVTAVTEGERLIDITAGDLSDQCYGIALDIGTTTVVGMLWDLHQGSLVDVEACTNYQSVYGADVISRIQFSMSAPGNVDVMQQKVIQCFNYILNELCARNEISPETIYDATIVGNTTMSHLVFGVDPRSMSRTPFAPVFCDAQDHLAMDLGIHINPRANVHLLPNIAGHVGSDIVGMMLAVGMDSLNGCHIAIDIGTNGEVVVVRDGKMLTCSTAAGPAFEGATIFQGMRAAPGAIEKVKITAEDVLLQTIDDEAPIGICGSGLIDAVAELLDAGLVDAKGRLLTIQEALDKGLSPAIADRIKGEGKDAYFVLASLEDADDMVLTQQDVREVQLAKGAILAGILTLMKELDIEPADLDSIKLAGAFGNYIDKKSALRIGLFPSVPLEKIISVGNAAGSGASMALLSSTERSHADAIARETIHVELSMNMTFQTYYMTSMNF